MLMLLVALLAPPAPTAVIEALDAWHAAAARADEAAYFAFFTADAVFVGTDPSEVWGVEAFRAYAHPHFAKGTAWTMRPIADGRRIGLAADGRTAWVYEPLRHEKYGSLRGSGVLVREGVGWRIQQYVLSFAVPNAVAKDVVPLLTAAPAATP